jgi:hypothetical protein
MRAPAAVLAGAFLFSACAGPSQSSRKALNAQLAAGDYAGAAAFLEKAKLTQYGKKNAVLWHLDMGAVLNYAGKYQESDRHFDAAEQRMEELFTKSVSKHAAMLVLNDNTVEYAGEPFERALLHVFRALNWTFLGKPEEAVVEARKVEQFLTELYEARERKSAYKDDAFARYLDSLLYADIGKHDDSRISLEAAMRAYQWYARDYHVSAPDFRLDKPGENQGELVFLHFAGTAPRKVSKTLQVGWGRGLLALNAETGDDEEMARARNAIRGGITGRQFTISYPEYTQDPFMIRGSLVKAGGASAESLLMQDLSAIAMKDLKDRVALVQTRAIARAAAKHVLAKAATDKVTSKYGKGWGMAAEILASGAAAATEVADTRGWNAAPSLIRMARMRLPAGKHDVTVDFTDGSGRVVSTHVFKDVVVEKGRRTYLQHRTAI